VVAEQSYLDVKQWIGIETDLPWYVGNTVSKHLSCCNVFLREKSGCEKLLHNQSKENECQ
jgi:hypothetical protein